MADIIIVEDDRIISELIIFNLQNEGYQVRGFTSGQALLSALAAEPEWPVSLFILDIMLPGMDGFAICRALRQMERFEFTPILMLTARGSESDKVRGLETGADDYLTKPFGMREFLARVQALQRRNLGLSDPHMRTAGPADLLTNEGDAPLTRPGMISAQDIVIDDHKHRVYRAGTEVEMTHREYELLKFLMIHKGVAYSRDDLLNYVWGYDYSGETRTVDVHIRQLRRKLEADDANPVLIETVRGRGYRFCETLDTDS
ncbi:MAG: response regulator transcription factor [Eubacteriales bacterium]|nr:response regulator transcription factor [Eubacteriales bacterium]MDD4462318.1 response regulator transcription factor [Eubacteriales bacterium]